MKTFLIISAIILLAGSVMADQTTSDYLADGKHLNITVKGKLRRCLLNKKIESAVESFDRSAVIVSERGYVSTEAAARCMPNVPIKISLIPAGVGTLADINLRSGLYVSLDFVSVQPMTYVATIARLNSVRNLVTLDGSFISGRKLSELQKHSFGSSGDAGSAAISPDGRYVAPAGQINCGVFGSPGVWDIAKNKRVITDDEACLALFGKNE
jgi:hypothetical protein